MPDIKFIDYHSIYTDRDTGVKDLLHRLGFAYKISSTFPGKADSKKKKELVAQISTT